MSFAGDSKAEPQVLYVELLDEGIRCLRPTLGIPLGEGRYRLLATPNYDPKDERWEFQPGSVVICRMEIWSGGEVLVARKLCQQG